MNAEFEAGAPGAIQRVDAGDSFVCTGRNLTRWPEELFVRGELSPLRSVVLSRNDLIDTGGELVAMLTALASLNLSRNRIDRIDAPLFECTTLISLDLSHNRLASVPDAIERLSCLWSLKLDSNAFSAADAIQAVCSVVSLTYLSLVNNAHLALPHPELSRLSRLALLDLRQCRLAALPDSVFELTSLRFLKLTHNALTELSPRVAALTLLASLTLENNCLRELPSALAHAASLKFLSVNGNADLASLPDALGVLPLEFLELGSNAFGGDAAIDAIASRRQLPVHRSNEVITLLRARFRRRLRCAAALLCTARVLLAPPAVRLFARGRGDLELLPPHALRDILDYAAAARVDCGDCFGALVDEQTNNAIVEFATLPIAAMTDVEFARRCIFRRKVFI